METLRSPSTEVSLQKIFIARSSDSGIALNKMGSLCSSWSVPYEQLKIKVLETHKSTYIGLIRYEKDNAAPALYGMIYFGR